MRTLPFDKGRLFVLFITYVAGNACTLGKTREEASADGRAFLGILCFKHDNDKYLVATNF